MAVVSGALKASMQSALVLLERRPLNSSNVGVNAFTEFKTHLSRAVLAAFTVRQKTSTVNARNAYLKAIVRALNFDWVSVDNCHLTRVQQHLPSWVSAAKNPDQQQIQCSKNSLCALFLARCVL